MPDSKQFVSVVTRLREEARERQPSLLDEDRKAAADMRKRRLQRLGFQVEILLLLLIGLPLCVFIVVYVLTFAGVIDLGLE